MAGALTPIERWQVLEDGVPAAGAKLYTYLSGTSTPQSVYNNADLDPGHAHANPVVADADGVFPVIFLAAVAYRFYVTNALDESLFAAQDNISDLWEVFAATTQTANRVYAGPASGSAAAPTFRALVVADIPAGGGKWTVVSNTDTGTQSAWAPGLAGNTLVEWSGGSAMTLNGIAGGSAGQIVRIKNTGSQIATCSYNSGSAATADKLINLVTSAGTPVAVGGWIEYQHDGTNWKLVDHDQGAWITPTFSAGDYTASSGNWTVDSGDITTIAYRLDGSQITIAYDIRNTDVSATPVNLQRVIPGGFTSAKTMDGSGACIDAAGTREFGVWATVAASAILSFQRGTLANWSATSSDNTSMFGVATFEVT